MCRSCYIYGGIGERRILVVKRKAASAITLTLMLTSILTLAFNIQPVKAEPKTWIVDDDGPADFHTIQVAINHADNGDTVYIREGTYNENWQKIEIPVLGGYARILVNKTVSIVGENRDFTVIDGNGTTYAIMVMTNGVNITGVTIENASYAGICLYYYTHNVTISKNKVRHSYRGILLTGDSGYSNIIENEIVDNWAAGIDLSRSDCNAIYNNKIENNFVCGIYVGLSIRNSIRANNIINSDFGIALEEASYNTFYHNNFIDNERMQVSRYNIWDDGYPSGGNYWSDYVGVDVKSGPNQDLHGSDSIGDTPYVIDVNNRDRYPLMNPYGAPPPQTYSLTITTTVGGTTNPAPGTYSYTANSTVQVTAIPEVNYLFDYWELDSVNVGSVNPYTVLMDKNHTLKAVFSLIPPPLSVSISPLSASIIVGQSVTFTSTVSGGYTPYTYQWHLNGNPVSGATSNTWIFTPTTSGIYYVHLKVTDAKANTAQSGTARAEVAAVPVGGYSIPIKGQNTPNPLTLYLTLIAILATVFTAIRRKIPNKK